MMGDLVQWMQRHAVPTGRRGAVVRTVFCIGLDGEKDALATFDLAYGLDAFRQGWEARRRFERRALDLSLKEEEERSPRNRGRFDHRSSVKR
jgi:hypothetical protein